ncbi:hypothetical protein MNB_SUP05-7-223 [hydrothermal vent metagenome]|uniref:Uncharacterized protein n=1 Tax=hydrothermal vent metagenome TaxID=652676 RepID=A0A1W1DTX1_9ZZZZ
MNSMLYLTRQRAGRNIAVANPANPRIVSAMVIAISVV